MTLLSGRLNALRQYPSRYPRLIYFDLRHLQAKILRARCSDQLWAIGDTIVLFARWPPILTVVLASVSSGAAGSRSCACLGQLSESNEVRNHCSYWNSVVMATTCTQWCGCRWTYKSVKPSAPGSSAPVPKLLGSGPTLQPLTSRRRILRNQQHARQASKPKSSEHPSDNGTDERKSSNSEAGTSGRDKHSGQKSSKPPNKQVFCVACCD